jgi:hypothetical protein
MPAHKKPSVKKVLLVLPVSLDEQMRERLFNDEMGRIPKGALSTYVVNLIKRDLNDNSPIDLLGLLEGQNDA